MSDRENRGKIDWGESASASRLSEPTNVRPSGWPDGGAAPSTKFNWRQQHVGRWASFSSQVVRNPRYGGYDLFDVEEEGIVNFLPPTNPQPNFVETVFTGVGQFSDLKEDDPLVVDGQFLYWVDTTNLIVHIETLDLQNTVRTDDVSGDLDSVNRIFSNGKYYVVFGDDPANNTHEKWVVYEVLTGNKYLDGVIEYGNQAREVFDVDFCQDHMLIAGATSNTAGRALRFVDLPNKSVNATETSYYIWAIAKDPTERSWVTFAKDGSMDWWDKDGSSTGRSETYPGSADLDIIQEAAWWEPHSETILFALDNTSSGAITLTKYDPINQTFTQNQVEDSSFTSYLGEANEGLSVFFDGAWVYVPESLGSTPTYNIVRARDLTKHPSPPDDFIGVGDRDVSAEGPKQTLYTITYSVIPDGSGGQEIVGLRTYNRHQKAVMYSTDNGPEWGCNDNLIYRGVS